MFDNVASEDPVGFLAAATELLAKLPSELWRTGNDGFADIAAAVDALAVQLDCTPGRSDPGGTVPRGRVRVVLRLYDGLAAGQQ